MTINFSGDIFPLYATNVITDAEYLAIDPTRRDEPFEQNLLTMIEVTRGFMAELRDDDQARMFHYAISRMLASTAYNNIYADLVVSVSGNVKGIDAVAVNGDTVDMIDANGTDSVILAAAPYADMVALVADINGQIVTTTGIEAFDDGGTLGFRNPVATPGEWFAVDYGAGPSLLVKAGMEEGLSVNAPEFNANAGRDDALAHFERVANPVSP